MILLRSEKNREDGWRTVWGEFDLPGGRLFVDFEGGGGLHFVRAYDLPALF